MGEKRSKVLSERQGAREQQPAESLDAWTEPGRPAQSRADRRTAALLLQTSGTHSSLSVTLPAALPPCQCSTNALPLSLPESSSRLSSPLVQPSPPVCSVTHAPTLVGHRGHLTVSGCVCIPSGQLPSVLPPPPQPPLTHVQTPQPPTLSSS
eukprot:CAMPEP_0181318514 /NCGR_PEP_ID=MMETSP1101-20121128/17044_1 /TAXON_ID=46948 /ORGANISM="Rhodomonas abbreviata, Strain Caron Lab Isolate" /LENGTH=151 /DNA_ID=CAMNT_0023425983 /DNA_START=70 /DNA_END=521 /DNA_ORIENTATION=+